MARVWLWWSGGGSGSGGGGVVVGVLMFVHARVPVWWCLSVCVCVSADMCR